jgi:hypothetical protein
MERKCYLVHAQHSTTEGESGLITAGVAAEEKLSEYLRLISSARVTPTAYVALHPISAFRAVRLAKQVPVLRVDPSDSHEGSQVRGTLIRQSKARGRSPLHRLTAVLDIPEVPDEYTRGRAKQTLRRHSRAAERLGIWWARVDEFDERVRLIALANANERTFPRERYRHATADHRDLLDHPLWLAAYSSTGQPLLLSVTAIDDDVAVLAYFRVLGTGIEHTKSRYYMMPVLVNQLSRLRVRHLLDEGSPVNLPDGLRQYQRSVGFKIMQVQVRERRSRGTQSPAKRRLFGWTHWLRL